MSSTLDRELDGSMDVAPTAAERDIARKMNIDPNKLARARAAREAQQAAASDADRIKEFERLTTARNPLARQATEPHNGTARPTAADRDIARRMNLDPGKLAQAREARDAKDRDDILGKWDGHINPGGPPDRSYELTALDQEACRKLGVDPQQFLAWKRDPTSTPRPKGLPVDPYDQIRQG